MTTNWKKRGRGKRRRVQTWSVNALVCLVTKKFNKLAPYAIIELIKISRTRYRCVIASVIVASITLGSITSVAGSKTRTAIGDM